MHYFATLVAKSINIEWKIYVLFTVSRWSVKTGKIMKKPVAHFWDSREKKTEEKPIIIRV